MDLPFGLHNRGAAAPAPRARWQWWAGLLAATLAWVWVTTQYLLALLVDFSDTWVHLALIRRTMERGWFPGDPFYAGLPTPAFYSLTHVLFAELAGLTDMRAHEVFVGAAPVIAVITIGAVFFWLRALTGDVRVAVIGSASALLVQVTGPSWAGMPYPREMALAPQALALLCYLHGRSRRNLPLVLGAGAALGVCLSLHLVTGAICLLSLVFLDWSLARPHIRPSPHLALAIGTGLLVSAPWWLNVLRLRLDSTPGTGLAARWAPDAWTFAWGSIPLTLYRPGELLNALPAPLWLPLGLGLVFALARWRAGRRSLADRFLLIAIVAMAVLLMTPLYGIIRAVALGWSKRLVCALPLSLCVGLGMVGAMDWARGRGRSPGVRLALTAAVLCLNAGVVAAVAWPVYQRVAEGAALSRRWRASGPAGTWNLAAQVAATGPIPAVVLSDPDTSYLLPYLLGSYVVTMPPNHSPPYAAHADRWTAVRRFYAGASTTERLATLSRYAVDAVIVAPLRSWPLPGFGDQLLARLRRTPAFVDTRCCGPTMRLFRYDPPGAHGNEALRTDS